METTIAKGGRGFHANSQGPMLFGVGNADIPGVEFDTEHPHNTWNQDKCVTCHMYEKDYENADNPGIFGHTFKARFETCLACHSNATVESMEQMTEDFQAETQALMHEFEEAWPAQWKTIDGDTVTIRNAPDTKDPPQWDGPPVQDPVGNAYREAWWNYAYVEEDFSLGVHNPGYARQLLQTAIARVKELNAAQ
jgi:formate-dependent nitrite reductase cytochrome c552 subunit